ncbi:MAG: heavy metal translocating P-type ATPase metal-binding domain-containing protein [Bdellovibrionaceae bacterium]|nr:heavy metal translocating P-type ATPase metal-binding domain-containing protein [Pseudobdellovibrionaceae bacterium]
MERVIEASTCLHCGDRVLAERSQFCCSGCEFVYSLLNRQGLSEYYRIRETKPKRVAGSSETFAYCDDPEFVKTLSGDGRTLDFYLEGVDCTACVWLLEKLPELCPDADDARLRLGTSRLRVKRTDDGSFARIARALDGLGFRPRPVPTETEATRAQQEEDHQDLVRLGVAAFATGNIMLLAVSLYAGADGILGERFRWISGLLATPALTYSAWPFYRSAWAAIRHARLNIDVPIVLAILAGIIASLYGLWSGRETLYFDSLSMLVLLLLASRTWLKRLRRTYFDTNDIDRQILAGTVQKIEESGRKIGVSALSLRAGDLISVPTGQFVPVDGIVMQEGRVQNAALTGESVPERRIAGDVVEAGARVVSEHMVLRAATDFGKSRLAQILREAENDARSKPRWIQFSDRVAHAFIVVVLVLAGLTFAAFVFQDPGEGARRALALVIVTCPCVFGMAIPLSLSLAIRESARRGVIVKNADLFERLSKISDVIFDKTGTLTEGDMHVVQAVGEDDVEAVGATLAMEAGQMHPVARAIREYFSPRSITMPATGPVISLPGGGLSTSIGPQTWKIEPYDTLTTEDRLLSGVRVSCDDRMRLEIVVEDRIKPGARETVRWFQSQGVRVHLLSGDHPTTVDHCARQLGLTSIRLTPTSPESYGKATGEGGGSRIHARLRPEQKAEIVREMGTGTLMIGDGANDAAALAAATASIAVHGAMDVSLKVSDAYVMRSNLDAIPILNAVARRTRRAIARNLIFSATFNLAAGGLAIAGSMTPLWAAILMPLSSITVLASSLAAAHRGEAKEQARKQTSEKISEEVKP